MARHPRYAVAGLPQHVIQRGNNRAPIFVQPTDYERFRRYLRDACERSGCRVHAYVLMTNHVHLLLTPGGSGQVAALMQALGRRYVRYINDRHHRTGTLWEGRYKACPVDGESYLLHCYRYIELNPVRAGMVVSPADYPWSSYRANALGLADPVLEPHALYLGLGATPASRAQAWARICGHPLSERDLMEIRIALQKNRALGPEDQDESDSDDPPGSAKVA